MLAIRVADFSDPVAQQLAAACRAELIERYGGEDAPLPTPEEFSGDSGRFLVGWLGDRAVAGGGVRRLDAVTAEIKRMYVAPDVRGHGHSRVLLAALEAVAADLGYQQVWLETGTRQPEAIALYESSGYSPLTPYGWYRDAPDVRCYAKNLTVP